MCNCVCDISGHVKQELNECAKRTAVPTSRCDSVQCTVLQQANLLCFCLVPYDAVATHCDAGATNISWVLHIVMQILRHVVQALHYVMQMLDSIMQVLQHVMQVLHACCRCYSMWCRCYIVQYADGHKPDSNLDCQVLTFVIHPICTTPLRWTRC